MSAENQEESKEKKTPLLDQIPALRSALATNPEARQIAEDFLRSKCLEPRPAQPAKPPHTPKKTMRLLFLCPQNWLLFDEDRTRLWNWSTAATGALIATQAVLRYLDTWTQLDIFAMDRQGHWEGRTIRATSQLSAAPWDIVMIPSLHNAKLVALANSIHVSTKKKYAFVHELFSLPFGPWSTTQLVDATPTDWTLLCPSRYIMKYVHTYNSTFSCRLTYAADYEFLNTSEIPLHRPWTAHFVTCISPCESKGISLFIALALALPEIRFLAVITKWTKERDRARMTNIKNIELMGGVPPGRMDEAVFRKTRILFVPSLWPEPYGLVALEACIRGIPVISSNVGGLPEANVLATTHRKELSFDVPFVYNIAQDTTLYSTCEQKGALTVFEEEVSAGLSESSLLRKATESDMADFVKVHVVPLVCQYFISPATLRQDSVLARECALDFLSQRRHSLATLLQEEAAP